MMFYEMCTIKNMSKTEIHFFYLKKNVRKTVVPNMFFLMKFGKTQEF